MESKKKLLFIIPDLDSGGAEKSLITILSLIDYDQYEVDLKLFIHQGIFLSQIPSQVHILPAEPLIGAFSKGFKNGRQLLKAGGYGNLTKWLWIRALTKKLGRWRIEDKIWKMIIPSLSPLQTAYDVCIAFLEEYPVYYMTDYVNANTKIAFLHINYKQARYNSEFDRPFYKRSDKIVTVSEESKKEFEQIFPEFKNKLFLFDNLISYRTIHRLANKDISNDFWEKYPEFRILTVGRLEEQKGYDIGISAMKILLERNHHFHWFILGSGSWEKKLTKLIQRAKLDDRITLLGVDENPYRYMKQCDLYFQPSRWEGKPVATREAICLAPPIITSDIQPFQEIFKDFKGALLIPLNATLMANAIEQIKQDPLLTDQLRTNNRLIAETEHTDITAFYDLIESKN